jgi:cysteine desulfurase
MIYLDHAATTPTDKRVVEALLPFLCDKFGNPSSQHFKGQESLIAIDNARESISKYLNCSPQEIIFTSGATESDNLILKGSILASRKLGFFKDKKPHIITSNIEHPAILETLETLKREQHAEITLIKVNSEGLINPEDIKKEIKPNTVLVSIMYANNEIGTIQPITAIGKMLKRINEKRQKEKLPKIAFHSDAVQGIGYLESDVKKLFLDSLSLSAHKIYGPKGIGLLYVKKGTRLQRIQDGGEQEYRLRAGTLNTPGIVGMAKALEINQKEKEENNQRMRSLRDNLIDKVLSQIPNSRLNGSPEYRIPSNANFSFKGVEGEGIMLFLSEQEIAVSTGSACSSGSLEPSHVIEALGLHGFDAHSSLRISLGKDTTQTEIDQTVEALKKTIQKLQKISGSIGKKY